ncbi:hypothetical protein WN66_01363 [Saccharomyces cerevisiae]|uniref:EC1118_1D0_5721p n=1 Tax=Saccharomyces cerevisiae (strain Lalvin EC1118 / Prise de mousse) TaxID=643680 RepID=C8Z5K2_YEAS8|nr:hypothetical protein WN66_01363 [Saccharomyces cerevisiae]CAY78791.1 EC1118_1D0_5721p [Saccharomyces cerevisiae EC1118]
MYSFHVSATLGASLYCRSNHFEALEIDSWESSNVFNLVVNCSEEKGIPSILILDYCFLQIFYLFVKTFFACTYIIMLAFQVYIFLKEKNNFFIFRYKTEPLYILRWLRS